MKTIGAFDAQTSLLQLLKETTATHQPIEIQGADGSAVLLSHDDWQSIQETLYLLSIPGMRESIQDGLRTPLLECSLELLF